MSIMSSAIMFTMSKSKIPPARKKQRIKVKNSGMVRMVLYAQKIMESTLRFLPESCAAQLLKERMPIIMVMTTITYLWMMCGILSR